MGGIKGELWEAICSPDSKLKASRFPESTWAFKTLNKGALNTGPAHCSHRVHNT